MSRELAARGMNVILHGRNPEKLERVKSEIAAASPEVSLRILVADGSTSHGMKKSIEAMAASIDDLPEGGKLTMLINNAGGLAMLEDVWTGVADNTPVEVDAIINLNLRFPTQLTRALLPRLKKDAPSLILNHSSGTAVTGMPYVATYSGTKAFNQMWSWGLNREIQAEGLDIQCMAFIIGTVSATSGARESAGFFTPDASDFVKCCLARVGCGKAVATPFWGHAVQTAFLTAFPETLQTKLVTMTLRGARDRYYQGKKQA